MSRVIFLLCLVCGNGWAGWYTEAAVSYELGDPTLLVKMDPTNPKCSELTCEAVNNGVIAHVAAGYQRGRFFVEAEHKSLFTDRDENGGYYGITFGARWGNR